MEGDTLLGYFLCYYVLDECEIARIAVAESERRRGIGQMLFEFMEQICHEKQLKRMLLDVRKSNQTAIAFYEKKTNLESMESESSITEGKIRKMQS